MNWTNLFNIILNQSGLKWNEKRIRYNLFISEAESEEELRYHWEEIQMGMGMDYLNENQRRCNRSEVTVVDWRVISTKRTTIRHGAVERVELNQQALL